MIQSSLQTTPITIQYELKRGFHTKPLKPQMFRHKHVEKEERKAYTAKPNMDPIPKTVKSKRILGKAQTIMDTKPHQTRFRV